MVLVQTDRKSTCSHIEMGWIDSQIVMKASISTVLAAALDSDMPYRIQSIDRTDSPLVRFAISRQTLSSAASPIMLTRTLCRGVGITCQSLAH